VCYSIVLVKFAMELEAHFMLSFMNDDIVCINCGAWFNVSNLLLQQVLTEPLSKKKLCYFLYFI